MPQTIPQIVPWWLVTAAAVACLAAMTVWLTVVVRLLPVRRRRPVPWRAIDLLVILAVYLSLLVLAGQIIMAALPEEVTRPPVSIDPDHSSVQHMIMRMLKGGDAAILLLCVVSAVIVAPIVEEFLFRVVLQGWLEAGHKRLEGRMPNLRRIVPGAIGPILISSFVFAMIHFRVDTPMRHPAFQIALMVAAAAAGPLTMGFAVWMLRIRAGARTVDFGWSRKYFLSDVILGLAAFAGLAGPIYGIQMLCVWMLPKYFAPDPVALFFLALALGTLYYRTHRIVPAIVLHMALNAASLAMAWMLLVNK